MGTFVGHMVPALALTLLGLWHTVNTSRSYLLKGSSGFVSRFWYPFEGCALRFKYLELVLIFSFSVVAIALQVLDFPVLEFSFKLNNFEHATMFVHLAIFAGFTLFAELIGARGGPSYAIAPAPIGGASPSSMVTGMSGILAASVFGQELFLLHFHSADHAGLEGHYHWLLQLIVSVSLVSALAATCFPASFHAALVLAVSVVFQGCWFMNMGFALWVPDLVPEGCVVQAPDAGGEYRHGAVVCGEAMPRAVAIANLQFSWILSGILMLTGGICLVLAGKYSLRSQRAQYEQLQNKGIDVAIVVDGYK